MHMQLLPQYGHETNCYLVWGEEKKAVLIDAMCDDGLQQLLEDNQLKLEYVAITHGHYDHIAALAQIVEKYHCKVVIAKPEAYMLRQGCRDTLFMLFGKSLKEVMPNILLTDGESFQAGDLSFTMLETPGHTKGGACYLVENCLFSGDTLFQMSMGRTDFPGGNEEKLLCSLKKLALLPGDYRVYPGHGAATTLEYERKHNPYMANL